MSAPPATTPRRTPLFEAHRRLGARMVEFGGWQMPVQYRGILEEHRAVRTACGLFDVSHMGELELRGPRALEAVQGVITNDAARLVDGAGLYTVACLPSGGVVDDLIVYRLAADRLLLVVNASNVAKDRAWFVEHAGPRCPVVDRSDEMALLAIQGPRAAGVVAGGWRGPELAGLRAFRLAEGELLGRRVLAARTGYTGEDGFELCCAADDAVALWDALLEAGRPAGLVPCGLGARDTLRLEARLCLYGNELDETTSPLEAGLDWVVKPDKGDFIGREALVRQRAEGVARRLIGLRVRGRGIARHGYAIHEDDGAHGPGAPVGQVTSGAPSPTLGYPVALGYVPARLAELGARLWVDCRGKPVEAEVVAGPFYRRSA